MTAQSADFEAFQNWDEDTYLLNGGDGTLGAVTFEEESVVGAFFDTKSKRGPFARGAPYSLERFFFGMPSRHRLIAEQRTLRYCLLEIDGKSVPCVTAVFWDQGEYLTAAYPWGEVLANGVDVIRIELMEDASLAIQEWENAYGMSPAHLAFVRNLFQRKLTQPKGTIELTKADVQFLKSTFEDPRDHYSEIARLMRREDLLETQAGYLASIDPAAAASKALSLALGKFASIGFTVPKT
jgi:hypothetical protein